MKTKVILEKQDLRYLKWSHARSSSGTVGTFLKAQSVINGQKLYYKLSNFDREKGVIGHESINEIIVDRLLTILGVDHVHYQLIHADIEIDGKEYTTYVCASEDFKQRGESKAALDVMYRAEKYEEESAYEYCRRIGFSEYIDAMLAIDFIILNRDRHGANIEVLRNARKHTIRIAPYFDHGLSLMFSCHSDNEIAKFDIMSDTPCNNFIGSKSTLENLKLISSKNIFKNKIKESDRDYMFEGLGNVLSQVHQDKIWDMITERYHYYENI